MVLQIVKMIESVSNACLRAFIRSRTIRLSHLPPFHPPSPTLPLIGASCYDGRQEMSEMQTHGFWQCDKLTMWGNCHTRSATLTFPLFPSYTPPTPTVGTSILKSLSKEILASIRGRVTPPSHKIFCWKVSSRNGHKSCFKLASWSRKSRSRCQQFVKRGLVAQLLNQTSCMQTSRHQMWFYRR